MKKAATAAHKKSSGTAATNTTPADLESSQGLVSDTTVAAGAEGGPISWQDIVVCIVADGRQKCPEKVKVALEMLGCYQSSEGIMTDFQQDPVQAHVFEHTSSVHLVPEPKKGTCRLEASKIPIQYLVCMK